ncbi:MAG TPA: serine/threonine-protein kinase [Kofleriaceae bacterium]|nr:serine/threonine-protein kinase [Kofleriaceae bacterium]
MGTGRSYLAAFASVHTLTSAEERRQVTRQGLAMLAEISEREPAPLEGLPADQLLLAVRAALADGMLGDLAWLSPASAAIAMFELAQALPAGAERRELGRRVLTRLREADRDTFVRLLIALARTSPKIVASEGLRARLEVVLAAPLTAPGTIGELAIGLLAQPSLAQSWVEVPATGSLPGRRLAARLLAHGAREAVRRHDSGDRGGVRVLARAGLREALARLLGDREALVWRFASIARGILAHVDSALADDIDRELRPSASNTEQRRASASAAAALERGGGARRWSRVLVERAAKEPGIARGAILGLAGLAIALPAEADELATKLVARAPLEAAEAIAELRREEASPLLADATAMALDWTRDQMKADPATMDDSRYALLFALEAELSGSQAAEGIGVPINAARTALDLGDIPTALREARVAVDEITAAADWLDRASDDDPIDRRHSMRLLRELDRELLADNALPAVLALSGDTDPARQQFAKALASIERSLLDHELRPEAGAVKHGGLRIARLRALVRLLDGVRASGETDLEPRLAAVRQLMTRAADDQSSLRRAVWAAMTRAGDALLRDGHAEVTDLLLAWTMAFPDDDFAIVREASMVPDIESSFGAYAQLNQATWAAADPDDAEAVRAVVEKLGELADALPPEQSPRVESVRLALARLGNLLTRLMSSTSQEAVEAGTLDSVATELGALARRTYGARRRLGLAATDYAAELETAVRAIETVLAARASKGPHETQRIDIGGGLDEAIAQTIDHARSALPPALGSAIERILVWLARRPIDRTETSDAAANEVSLPGWVPLSRLLGGFYVVRPIGRGAGGSVLLAVRAEERNRAERELVALKVPDYSGDAARSMSEQEFEKLFREEAGALLALPEHPNLARFITFDASAQPKPILAMEYVRGTNLERTLESRLDMRRAVEIIDDLLAGLEAMHAVRIAHLDVKPPNLVLREGAGRACLVDFGLAGRHIRTGCGSAHYGAAEVWAEDGTKFEPFGTDVYAAACVAFEVLTGTLLFRGENLQQLLDQHFAAQPAAEIFARMARDPRVEPLADLLRAAVTRDPRKRPTISRLRAGFAAIVPDLRTLDWPISTS